MYTSSSELQYIVELGGQHLLPAPNAGLDNYIPISKRLQLLRDNAQAWFRFNIHLDCSKTISMPEHFHYIEILSLFDGHLCLQDVANDKVEIFPILPKPSQQMIKRDWSTEPPSYPNVYTANVFMDPAQNLIATAYHPDLRLKSGDEFYIDLGVLDGDGDHPQAAGRILFPSPLLGRGNKCIESTSDICWKLGGLGRHIAIRCTLLFNPNHDGTMCEAIRWLQIWDWQHSATSNVSRIHLKQLKDLTLTLDLEHSHRHIRLMVRRQLPRFLFPWR